MTVADIYRVLEKKSGWAIWIFDETGRVQLGYCNASDSYKWENVADAVKRMEVTEIVPCIASVFLKVSFEVEATYQSEERAVMDGYTKVYESGRKNVYAKEITQSNSYNGEVDILGYTFAVVEGYK